MLSLWRLALRCSTGNVEHGAACKICHVLGGTWNLPHAETHTIILPHAISYNAAAAPDAMRRLGRSMNALNAAGAIFSLMQKLDAPTSLEEIGMKRVDLPRAASLVIELP